MIEEVAEMPFAEADMADFEVLASEPNAGMRGVHTRLLLRFGGRQLRTKDRRRRK